MEGPVLHYMEYYDIYHVCVLNNKPGHKCKFGSTKCTSIIMILLKFN